jgi:hypothetical protein
MKRKCVKCNRTKTARNFSYRKHICNKCYKEGDAYRNVRDSYLQKNYGLSIDEYDLLLRSQGNGCAICGGKSGGKNLAVDHDHKSGEVRGLLCKRHNSAIARWIRNADEAYQTYWYFNNGAKAVQRVLGRVVEVPDESN